MKFCRTVIYQINNLLGMFFTTTIFKMILFSYLVIGDVWKSYIAVTLGTTFVISAFYFLFGRRAGKIYIWIWAVLISLILLTNLWHLRYFQFPFSFYEVLQIKNLNGLGPSIAEQFRWVDILFILDVIMIPFFGNNDKLIKYRFSCFTVVLLIGIVSILLKPVQIMISDNISLSQVFRKYDNNNFMSQWSPVVYVIKDTIEFLKTDKQLVLSESEKDEIEEWFRKHREIYYLNNNKYYGEIGKGKNLIVLQVESLENFTIGSSIDGQEITPNINRLLKNAIYFSGLEPNIRAGGSSDAELLFNTSLYPLLEGSTYFRYPYNQYNSLGKILKDQGYATLALHGDEGTFWNRKMAYPNLSFDNYYDLSHYSQDDMIGMGLSDQSFLKQSINILESEKRPFYGFLITLTSHTPFTLPEALKALKFTDGIGNFGNYLQAIHYTDSAIGHFIDDLSKQGILDDSIIVIYGDHPAVGLEQHIMTKIKKADTSSEVGKVPFIIYSPAIKGLKLQGFGRQVDMFPTIANIMGVDFRNIELSAMGVDLLKYQKKIPVSDNEQRLSDLMIKTDYFDNKTNQ